MDSILSIDSDVDDGRLDTPPRRNCHIQIRVPTFSNAPNGFHQNGVEDALDQPAQATSSSALNENNGKFVSHRTHPRTCDDQRSAPPKFPRILKELDIDDGLRFTHPAVSRTQRRQETKNVATPSPSTRASKRRAGDTQPPPKAKRSRATRNAEDDDGDADQWENQDQYSSEVGLEKNEARMKRNPTPSERPIYDMKFHPMDRRTRPKVAATRRVVAKETEDVEATVDSDNTQKPSSNGPNNTERRRSQRSTRGKHSRNLQYSRTPTTKRVAKNIASKSAVVRKEIKSITPGNGNLLRSLIGVDFDQLCSMDRILHNIQYGAPLDSISLPHSWAKVRDILVNEGFFTKDQYKAWGGATVLKRRYDAIRCVVQGEYAKSEKNDTKDQALYWAEGIDVLDLVGSRTVYKHKGIPEFMEGIEEFTQNKLDQKKQEFLGSADEAPSNIVLDGESSRISSKVADPVVANTGITTGGSLQRKENSLMGMAPEDETRDTPLHSENSSVVVEEHVDQEAAVEIHLSPAASPASTVADDGLSPVPNIIAPVEQNESKAHLLITKSASNRSPQFSKMKGKSSRRSKRSKSSSEAFTIHEDTSGSTPRATEDLQRGIVDNEDPKENATEEEDNVDADESAETDVSDSPIAASGRNSNGHRAISPNRGGEIADAPPHPVSDPDPDLPSNNLSRSESSHPGVPSIRTPRSSSTLTSTTLVAQSYAGS